VGTTISIPGSGNQDITVFGRGTVIAGNGNDRIHIEGKGTIVVGSGHDTLTLNHGGVINQYGASGHDTIHLGSTGNYVINEQGHATVTGAFGTATIAGATMEVFQSGGQERVIVLPYGQDSLLGASTGFVGGSGSTHPGTRSGHSTTVSGSSAHGSVSSSSSHGSSGAKPVDFLRQEKGGQHVIKNFVSGQDHLFVDGNSLPFMASAHDISGHGPNTVIRMNGGKTTIELHIATQSHGNNH
jgi:hypothetical protein